MTWSWMKYHACLCENDAIILGASNLNQLKENLETLEKCKPLSKYLLDKLNNLYAEYELFTLIISINKNHKLHLIQYILQVVIPIQKKELLL